MIIQIYAFTRIDDVHDAVAAGVDHIGFVAGNYNLVNGELDFLSAAELAREVTPPAKSVALTMSNNVDEILRMTDAVQPDIVHISTETDLMGADKMTALRKRLDPNIKLMKAIGVMDQNSIADAHLFSTISDILLLDTKIRDFPGVGATGKTHDWNVSREIVRSVSIPVILAGGLSSLNVIAAIQSVKPWGVDSNTSTNVCGSPYIKDMDRIREFVKTIRSSKLGESDGTI
jgi:phosphoribosylanthranilate isomerase